MAKVAVIAGYGKGISASFSRKFGKDGFSLALLARTASRLDAAVAGERLVLQYPHAKPSLLSRLRA